MPFLPFARFYHALPLFAKISRAPVSLTPPILQPRRPGPKHQAYGIPSSEWPTVLRRVLEDKESLRKVADEYGVSHETIRRLVRTVGK